jgi:hypothetical protein
MANNPVTDFGTAVTPGSEQERAHPIPLLRASTQTSTTKREHLDHLQERVFEHQGIRNVLNADSPGRLPSRRSSPHQTAGGDRVAPYRHPFNRAAASRMSASGPQ